MTKTTMVEYTQDGWAIIKIYSPKMDSRSLVNLVFTMQYAIIVQENFGRIKRLQIILSLYIVLLNQLNRLYKNWLKWFEMMRIYEIRTYDPHTYFCENNI